MGVGTPAPTPGLLVCSWDSCTLFRYAQVLKMVRSFFGCPLLIFILLGSSGQLSSATAGVIPFENWKEFHQNGSSLECSNGSYRAIEYHNGRESPICRVCSQCGCGVIVQRQCSLTADTVCTEQCQDANDVFNQTLRACVSLLGGADCSTHALTIKPRSAEFQDGITTMSRHFTELVPESGSDLSPLRAFGIASGVIVVLTIGASAILLIARRRGYLKGIFQNTSFCKTLDTATPKIKRAITPKRQKYEMLLQRLSRTITGEIPSLGKSDQEISEEDLPGNATEEPRVIMSTDLPLAEGIQVSRGGEEPYWLVMRGWFTPQGGVLRCEDSDVYLEIPPGAIPESVERQEIVAKIALVTSRFEFKLKKDEVCLSPVVELLSPGLDAFEDLVTVYIPHRARLDPDWSFKVHYTHSHGETEGGWQTVDQEGSCYPDDCKFAVCHRLPSDVTFKTNKTHFVIRTPHFSKYVCSGCSKKRYYLNLEAQVFAKYLNLPGREQVDLDCYIVDTIKDYWHKVKHNEGQRPRSERHPILLKSKEPLTVSLLHDDNTLGKESAWRPETYGGQRPTCVAIPIRNIVRCCSDAVPYFVTFSLRPKTSGNHHDMSAALFESVVSYRQKESSLDLPISIAFDLREQNNSVQQLPSLPSTPIPTIDALIRNVAAEIPENKWKELIRHLLDGETNIEPLIEELQDKHRDIGEVKYQMLRTWRQRRGKDATTQKLSQTLRACGLVNIAEGIGDGTIECGSDTELHYVENS